MSENKSEKQGRIVTQNSDLLRLLRDKTEESLKQSRTLSKNVGQRNKNQNNSENVKKDGRYVSNPELEEPDLDKKSGAQIRHPSGAKSRQPSGTKVFSVVNPALLRAVGIKPTQEQEANFDSYSPRKNNPHPQVHLGKTQVDTNNNSSGDITYNNYLAEPSDYQSRYSEEGTSPYLQDSYNALQFESEESLKPTQKTSNFSVDSLDAKDSWSDVKGEKRTQPVDSLSSLEANRSRVALVPLGSDIQGTNPKAIPATSQTRMTSNKSPHQRVYIESPTFTQAEEEEYRFVSSRVDDYGDTQDTYRNLPVPSEPPESVSPMKGSKGSRRVHYEDSSEIVDSNRYEDVDESESNPRVNNSRQYVLKPSESTRSATSQPSELTVAPRQLPERAPGLGHRLPTGPSYDPEDEDELERETNYQVGLITRIGENTKRVSDLSVPKLSLPLDSDEEFARDSLDVDDTPHNNFVKDSLDLYNPHQSVKGIHPNQSPGSRAHPPNSYQQHQMVEPWQEQYEDDYYQHDDHTPTREPSVQPRFPQQQESQESYYAQGDMYMQPVPQPARSYQQTQSPDPRRGAASENRRHPSQPPSYRAGQAGYQENENDYDQHRNNHQSVHPPSEQFFQDPRAQPMIKQDPRQNYHSNQYDEYEDPRFQNMNQDPRLHLVVNQDPRSHPVVNQDPRSHPVMNLDPRSHPVVNQDPRAHLVMNQDPRSHSVKNQDPRSHPVRNQDPRTHPVVNQDPRSHPVMNQDPRSHPVMNQDQRSHPVLNQDPRSQPVMNQDPRSHPVVNQDPRSHPVMNQDPRSHPVMNQDPRSHPVVNQDPRLHPVMNQDPRSHPLVAGDVSYDRYSYDSYQDQGYDDDDQNYYDDGSTPTNGGTLSPPKQSSRNDQPKVDYIENNRKNYGRVPRKSYKEIQQIKKEEGMKLENRFIKPKVKPKKKQPYSAPVSNSKPDERYASSPQLNQKPTTAEELWAKKASNLSYKKGPRKQGKLTKFPSDGGLPISNRNPQDPASITHSLPPAGFVHSPLRKPLALEPISREIITDDGQRISVDVNLKLLTPPQTGTTNLYSQHQAFEDYGNNPVGVRYDVNTGYGALGPAYQQDYNDGYDYEQYYQDQRQDYPSARDYDSAPEYLDYSQPANLPEGRPVSNPYKVIPPIPTSSPTKPINPEDSYVVQYRRQKEKKNEEPWYKIYNLKDYRKMQKEVRLGSLGPDIDSTTHKEKIEKFQRQADYARMVNERNKKQTVVKRPPSYPRKQESTEDMLSKRHLAVEYSKTIPKPAVKPSPNGYNSYEVSGQIPMGGKLQDSPKNKASDMDVIDLENLRLRHERDKQNVEVIKQNMELQKG